MKKILKELPQDSLIFVIAFLFFIFWFLEMDGHINCPWFPQIKSILFLIWTILSLISLIQFLFQIRKETLAKREFYADVLSYYIEEGIITKEEDILRIEKGIRRLRRHLKSTP